MENPKGRVLCVEDDQDSREMVAALLKLAGYDVVEAQNVTQGLSTGRADNFDLILLDWMFRDGTGIELCKMLRSTGAPAPILFYSGVSSPDEIERAMRAGAEGFLIKPVPVEEFLQTVSGLVQRSAVDKQIAG